MAKEQVKAVEDNIFPDKYLKKISQEFVDAVAQMDTDEVKERIITTEGHLYEIAGAKEADNALTDAKERVKELSLPYRESTSEENAKLQFCLYTLRQRGVEL